MRKSGKMVIVAGFALLLAGTLAPARAAHTPDEAKALAEKAAAMLAADGEAAFPKFSDPKGEFVQDDLYVTVFDRQGVVRATPNPVMIGVNMWEATDPDGVKFTQEIVKLTEATGSGWESYKFTNPVSKKIEPKKAWVRRVGDFYVLCGVYVTQ
jgi:cytochrome c